MAIATIQNRRGLKKDFDPQKMKAGEWAVSTDTETDNQIVWMCFRPGVVKRMGTYEDFRNQVASATDEIREEYRQTFDEIKTYMEGLKNTTEGYKNTAVSKAGEASNSATTATQKASAASVSATNASASENNALSYSVQSKSYAVGEGNVRPNEAVDSAKFYYEQSKLIVQGLGGALLPMGTINFSQLSGLQKLPGYMYNIKDSFMTDSTFKDGAGHFYPEGTNVYYTADGYWDCLAGVLVTGVKGNVESSYRSGNVNITPANIGLGNVDNTADANKTVAKSNSVLLEEGTTGIARYVYFASTDASNTDAKLVYDNDFKYNPATNTLTVGSVTGKAGSAGTSDYTNYINANNIPANTNLNNLTTPGFYYCPANTTVATLTNSPTTNAFFMIVGKHAGVYQQITEYQTALPRTWIRNYYNGAWGSWHKVYNSADKPTPADIGALPLSGGTLTGALTPSAGITKVGRDGFTSFPVDAHLFTTGTSTGYIKVTLPFGFSLNIMIKFVVDIYNYADQTSSTYYIGGYPYQDSNWYNVSARCVGNAGYSHCNLPVRFGLNGNKVAITIGESTTEWNYLRVQVRDIVTSNVSVGNTGAGWAVECTTTALTSITKTVTNTHVGYNSSVGSVRDVLDGAATTFAYSKAGLETTNWIAAWNGKELRAISPANLKTVLGVGAKIYNTIEVGLDFESGGATFVASGEQLSITDGAKQSLISIRQALIDMFIALQANPGIFKGYIQTGRESGTTIGDRATAEGVDVTASGLFSHAEGTSTTASGISSHAEGSNTRATGDQSHAEGGSAKATGFRSHAEGYATEASAESSHASGKNTTASNFASFSCGKNSKSMAGNGSDLDKIGDVFAIGNGTPYSPSNAFRVTYAGATYGVGNFNTSGADYAEFIYEWADGNPNNEDRVGYFVTVKYQLLYKANSGDYITGITSGSPSIVGNADEDYYWRYERDEFNRVVWEDVREMVEKLDDEGNPVIDEETGEIVFEETGRIIKNGDMKQNPNYDSSLQETYVERKDRPEWDYVGMRGVIPVRDDGTCVPGMFCKCADGGIATLAMERGFDTYMVFERVNDSVVKVDMK